MPASYGYSKTNILGAGGVCTGSGGGHGVGPRRAAMEFTPFTHPEQLATLAKPEDLSRTGTPEPEEEAAADDSNHRQTVPETEPLDSNHLPTLADKQAQAAAAAGDDGERLLFGWGGCTPSVLQPLVSQRTFLAVFVMTCVLQGMYYTYVVSVLTTIEKLFQFQSKTTGILFSATEIGQISGALLLTYYGGQGHRPRWIGCGIALFAVCTFMCALPHFMYSDQLATLNHVKVDAGGRDNRTLCPPPGVKGLLSDPLDFEVDLNSSTTFGSLLLARDSPPGLEDEQCEDDQQVTAHAEIRSVVLAIFFVCLIGVGVGQTMAFNLGIPYMDDNVSSKESPMYFAFIIGMRIFGPVFGFVLGSLCTSIYVHPLESPNITTRDPRWIGAWWLGMFIISGMLALNAVIMFGFPRRLPHPKLPPAHANSPNHQQQVHHHVPPSQPNNGGPPAKNPSLREFPRAVKHLLQNDVLMCRTASNVLHVLPIAGLYTFLPKYLESQFRLTAYAANMVAGLGGILVMFLGILGSGIYIRKFQPSARFITGWIAISALLYSAGMAILMFVGCSQNDIVGLQPGNVSGLWNGTISCRAHCTCPTEEFSPVCGSDGMTYLSPCQAGCSSTASGDNATALYEGCSCVEGKGTAELGYCSLDCDNFYWFIPIFCVFVLIHSTSEVGGILITLRCVDPHEKALALGFIAVAIGLFGNVPCPIIYGAVVDSACLLWKQNCGQDGACWLYDTTSFRHLFFGITSAVMFAAFLVDCVVWYKAGKINAATAGHPAELGPHAVASSRTPEHAGQHPEAEPLKQAP
ncbi:Solute carrier organic anion transporter family member 3A1 [Amphibalanus amphitrite]|uniref:Solute carrier organic anion transporter family member n=1 Tax=Amphibalanus amphitrite TaxID=1232801 RepID=A0A6A4VG55_AMPAM|nr:Solute carrier organic anion transporter family member 3A1 [Amphibalanus amphitrite]